MKDLLLELQGHDVRSVRGVKYVVAEVNVGVNVKLSGRPSGPSQLAWDDIAKVLDYARHHGSLNTKAVDMVLGRESFNSSTMCALVLAMIK
jgi:hypothetical protein